jgi:hypothetical protein
MAFLTQNKAKFWKKFIITLVFKKNANFFAENWEKSQKIVIITSTPDWANFRQLSECFLWAVFWKWQEVAHIWPTFFDGTICALILTKIGFGYILGEVFTNSSGHRGPNCNLLLSKSSFPDSANVNSESDKEQDKSILLFRGTALPWDK